MRSFIFESCFNNLFQAYVKVGKKENLSLESVDQVDANDTSGTIKRIHFKPDGMFQFSQLQALEETSEENDDKDDKEDTINNVLIPNGSVS